jgi:hypothetical protein
VERRKAGVLRKRTRRARKARRLVHVFRRSASFLFFLLAWHGKGTGFHRRQNLKAARLAAAYRSGVKDPAAAFMSDVTRLGRESAPRERETASNVMRDSR